MAQGLINLDAMLERGDNGYKWTPEIEIVHGQWVEDPSRFKDGEPGRLYGPAKVWLEVAPDGGKTLHWN